MKNIALIFLILFSIGSCKQKSNTMSFNDLPELPVNIIEKLDTVKMTTAPRATYLTPPAEIISETASAPCCSITTYRTMVVTYPFTKCVPFTDRFIHETDEMVFYDSDNDQEPHLSQEPDLPSKFKTINRNIKSYKLTKENLPRGLMDLMICSTSDGPWNAQLTETKPCSGGTSFELVISAFDEIISFQWFGSISGHSPDIGLVDCEYDATIRSKCGISTCACSSNQCESLEPCDCGIDSQW